MGGYGALRFGLKYPELFGSVSAHSAALIDQLPKFKATEEQSDEIAMVVGGSFGDPFDPASGKKKVPSPSCAMVPSLRTCRFISTAAPTMNSASIAEPNISTNYSPLAESHTNFICILAATTSTILLSICRLRSNFTRAFSKAKRQPTRHVSSPEPKRVVPKAATPLAAKRARLRKPQ